MKKHILGLSIFCFIAFASVLCSLVFRNTNVVPLDSEIELRPSIEKSYLETKQATLNVKTGQFVFDVRSSFENDRLILKFYRITNNQIDLIATEKVTINQNNVGIKSSSYPHQYNWATKLNLRSNIYLNVEREGTEESFATKLNNKNATAVLLSDRTEKNEDDE